MGGKLKRIINRVKSKIAAIETAEIKECPYLILVIRNQFSWGPLSKLYLTSPLHSGTVIQNLGLYYNPLL